MLAAHVDAEEWGVALALARRHGLDPDEVHKAGGFLRTSTRRTLNLLLLVRLSI
jgi:hypothetical protein